MARSYFAKLKDPRWQKRRLEVMQRADFRCQECEDDKATLNVHHRRYRKGAEPWEYPDHELVCVCEDCHAEMEDVRLSLEDSIGRLGMSDLTELAGFAEALVSASEDDQSCDRFDRLFAHLCHIDALRGFVRGSLAFTGGACRAFEVLSNRIAPANTSNVHDAAPGAFDIPEEVKG